MPPAAPVRLRGRRILVTGAASGIGRRTAELFAAEGAAQTLLEPRRVKKGIEAAKEADAAPGGAA
jgi:NAD(P)-dependent dehydrogenase (short-subunit alcohol dehydrogenase family)